MPTGPGELVTAPPLTPPEQGLIRATPLVVEDASLPARWEAGVRFAPEVCGLPGTWALCSTSSLASGNNRRASREYEPWAATAYDECSVFGLDEQERAARARRALMAKDSIVLEREFWTGTLLPTNAHLADPAAAQVVGTSLGPVLGLAALTQALADAGVGRGMIHARPFLVSVWQAYSLLRWDGQRWMTARGDIVVPGSGYPGTGPNDEAVAAGVEWAYATELVQVYRGGVIAMPAPADDMGVAMMRLTEGAASVQTVDIPDATTGGTFTLTYAGDTTAAIAWDADAAAVAAALNALASVTTDGGVTATGGPLPATAVTVTFDERGARSAITGDGTALVDPGAVTVTQTTTGSSPGDYDNTAIYRAQRMLAAVHNGCAAPDSDYTHVAASIDTSSVGIIDGGSA